MVAVSAAIDLCFDSEYDLTPSGIVPIGTARRDDPSLEEPVIEVRAVDRAEAAAIALMELAAGDEDQDDDLYEEGLAAKLFSAHVKLKPLAPTIVPDEEISVVVDFAFDDDDEITDVYVVTEFLPLIVDEASFAEEGDQDVEFAIAIEFEDELATVRYDEAITRSYDGAVTRRYDDAATQRYVAAHCRSLARHAAGRYGSGASGAPVTATLFGEPLIDGWFI